MIFLFIKIVLDIVYRTMIRYYDPRYTGNQWYIPTTSFKLYDPRCKADIDSRQVWYDNVTKTDIKNDILFRKKVAMKKYPYMTPEEMKLFLQFRTPEYN